MTDWSSTVSTAPAPGVLVLSMQGQTPVDSTVTDNQGQYSVRIPASPTANDKVVFVAAAGDGQGSLRYLVANPGYATGTSAQVTSMPPNPQIWGWSLPATSASGQVTTISEAQGSGALRLFVVLRTIYEVTGSFYQREGLPLVVWLGYGVSWSCGACALARPPQLPSNTSEGVWRLIRAQVFIPGNADQGFYSDAVTVHELGHWVMASYGTSTLEGGSHRIGSHVYPGMAWSEGFATWFSSAVRNSPVYYDKQSGGFFWLDIGQRQYSGTSQWVRPVAGQGLLQTIDENEVSAMLLQISTAQSDAPGRILLGLSSPAMNSSPWGRGYTWHYWSQLDSMGNPVGALDMGVPLPMLADMFDALVCAGMPTATIDAATQPTTYYPYPSSAPICPGGACSGCWDTSNACQPGTTNTACGVFGIACRTCGAGQLCQAGRCENACQSTCGGCCDGSNTCQTGSSNGACGSGGMMCSICAAGEVCSAGICKKPDGEVCAASAQCQSGLCLLDYNSTTQGHCRTPCTPPASCGSMQVCMPIGTGTNGACVPTAATTSQWRVFLDSANVKPSPPGGGTWDALNGAPDPYACVNTSLQGWACTAEVSDTYTPIWSTYLTPTYTWSDLASGTIGVFDSDLTTDDTIDNFALDLRCPWAAYPCGATLDRSTVPSSGLNSITIYIYPL